MLVFACALEHVLLDTCAAEEATTTTAKPGSAAEEMNAVNKDGGVTRIDDSDEGPVRPNLTSKKQSYADFKRERDQASAKLQVLLFYYRSKCTSSHCLQLVWTGRRALVFHVLQKCQPWLFKLSLPIAIPAICFSSNESITIILALNHKIYF